MSKVAKWYRNSSGLWVPKGPYPSRQMDSRGPLDFVGVTLSYQQVYRKKATWDGLEKEIAPYSLEQIVIIICRISVSLYNQTLPWDPKTQLRICKGIFGREEFPRIFESIKSLEAKMKQKNDAAPILVFHEQQALNLLKAALLVKTENKNETCDNLAGIGKALLMITDLIEGEPGELLSVKIGDPEYLDRWLAHILGNYLFKSGSVSSAELARYYDLYLSDKPDLRDCGSYVNLMAVLQRIIGLKPDELWSLTYAVGAYWQTISEESIPDANMSINRNTYLTTQFTFTDEEVDHFFAFYAINIRELKKNVCQLYSLESIRPLDMLPFAKWPLVIFEDRMYSVSIPLLMQKLTTGLHYLYLDKRIEHEQRQMYLTYMGEVFEDYVHRAFNRMFPLLSERYLRLDDIRDKISTKYCDGLIAYEKGVILVESKASLFTFEARVGHDITAIRSRIDDIYLDGAKQLQATIDALRQGLRDDEGTIPNEIEWYLPVMITLEHIPMNPIIYGEVRKMLATQELLEKQDILQLQSINIGELEQIEAILESGYSFRELFKEKLSRVAEAEDSWANYLFRRHNKFKAPKNAFLNSCADELYEKALKYFAERQH
ncbi:MAG: hypothetical protein KKI12_13705 [Proteobacteria bacterium]|nr:hypothetical protein [Pseudomonadota bacterium]MBU4289215.1 hypothetical protein [Pseudomonadota bacterium]